MAGDEWQKFANLRLLFGLQFTTSGKKLQFMGSEIAQWNEWKHDGEIDWVLRTFPAHEGIRRLVCDLNRLYVAHECLYKSETQSDGFQWIVGDDNTNCVLVFIRQTLDKSQKMIVVANLTPAPHSNYRVGVPEPGMYKEVLNTDGDWYGGSGMGNLGGVKSLKVPSHGYEQSVEVNVPPLSVTVFLCTPMPEAPVAKTVTAKATVVAKKIPKS